MDFLQELYNIDKNIKYLGNLELLSRKRVAIVGSRKPTQYASHYTYSIAKELARVGVCVVSGGAMGVDAIAHSGAGAANTIAVMPCGIDLRYPAINRALLDEIAANGLMISQFEDGFKATNWSFVVRNRVVIALSDVVIITQADLKSGSMVSAEIAKELGKEIFVLPHIIGESEGTNSLLESGEAKGIYNIPSFIERFGVAPSGVDSSDEFLLFCATRPSYEDVFARFSDRLFEAELSGIIEIKDGRVSLV